MPNISESWDHALPVREYVDDVLIVSGTTRGILGSISRASQNTPGFGKLRRRGKTFPTRLPMNPFSYLRIEQKFGLGDWSRQATAGNPAVTSVHRYSGILTLFGGTDGGTLISPSASERQQALEKVNAKLLDKLKGSSVNLAQVFAERKMTASMIEKSAMRIAASFQSVRKGNLKEAAKILGSSVSRRKVTAFNAEYSRQKGSLGSAVANGWLELQYGWKPLLQDIYGTAEWLAKQQSKEISQKVVSRHTIEMEEYLTPPKDQGLTVIQHQLCKYEFTGTVWFTTSGSELASAAQAGITNPALLAWELLPYSFVVDWFLPVGNFLSNLDATLGLRFDRGCYTTYMNQSGTSNVTAFNEKYDNGLINANIRSSRSSVKCERSVMLTFPSPTLPSFKNPLGVTHALNAIALLSQVFKR